MEKFIKENIIFILLVILVLAGGLFIVYKIGYTTFESYSEMLSRKEELTSKKAKLEQIRLQKEELAKKNRKESQSGKVIYEVLGKQFSPEASFGIMFENILTHVANSGLRIRSIDYNYSPQEDKILMTNLQGYNACELGFVAVGTYAQFQTFFKEIAKENYLSNLNEIYIEPYDKNKSVLISKFKVRIYTKSI